MYKFLFLKVNLIIILSSILSVNICNADTVVRFNMEYGINVNVVDLRLFDADTPKTVINFMSYVNDGSYDNSFIHRSVADFVIQGGGYKYDPNFSEVTAGLSNVVKKSPIVNEPGISNTRGTIAMAKVAGDPDSATSQWFFNLVDNSAVLDPDNGGFTVFGEVINNGMSVIDSISTIPTYPMGCLFLFGCLDELPLLDYISAPALISNLVKITKAEGLIKVSPDYDFGPVLSNAYLQSEFIIENISQQNILIGTAGANDPVAAPFAIINNQCNNITLLPGNTCNFLVSFNPVTINSFIESFSIELPGLGFDYTVNVSGEGVLVVPDSDSDKDGVSDIIENAGPYAGDGNHDNVLDSVQSNVVSIQDSKGTYVTLTGSSFITYRDVHFVDKSQISNTPGNVASQIDVIWFTLSNLQPDQNAQIGMILPAAFDPGAFYIYGPTDNAVQPDWFEFTLDANTGTGAESISNFTYTAGNGELVTDTLVSLYLKNAARGDSTFDADNEIKVVGALSNQNSESSSGQLGLLELCLLLLIITYRTKFSCSFKRSSSDHRRIISFI